MTEDLSRQAKDVVQKLIADVHRNTLVNWYGLSDVHIVETLPSSVPMVSVHEHVMDRVFLTATGDILHLEFQSHPQTDLRRFLAYAVALIHAHGRPVRTVVVYLYPARTVPSRLDGGSVQFHVHNIMIADKSGPTTWQHLQQLAAAEWTDTDILDLTFYPFMNDVQTRAARALQAAQLATMLPRTIQRRVGALMLGLTSTFLDAEVVKLLKEVLKMNDLVRELEDEAIQRGWQRGIAQGLEEGRQKGWQEGRQEGRQEGTLTALQTLIIARFGSIPATLESVLKGLTEAQMLNLMPQVLSSTTVDELQALMERR